MSRRYAQSLFFVVIWKKNLNDVAFLSVSGQKVLEFDYELSTQNVDVTGFYLNVFDKFS